MTHHAHASELQALEQKVRAGDLTADRAAQELLDKVKADVPAEDRTDYLNGLREHATDGVGVRIVEQVISHVSAEHPTP